MNVFNYYIDAFKNYANFSGRATRSEYWYFALFNFIFTVACAAINPVFYFVYYAATLIPSLSAAVRRAHDVGKSGWFLLIPIYGFVLLFFQTQAETNKWGDPPAHDDEAPTNIKAKASTPNLQDLGKLHELYKAGALSEDEYVNEKNKILKKSA